MTGKLSKMQSSLSPSTRREWIEMKFLPSEHSLNLSPSTRREWIEISLEVKK